MKLLPAVGVAALLASFACSVLSQATAPASDVAPTKATNSATTIVCGDSLRRADGTQRAGTPCNITREYCYEASGGAAISHGAHCRPLPKPGATCVDVVTYAGSSCTGTPATGLRVQFAFP